MKPATVNGLLLALKYILIWVFTYIFYLLWVFSFSLDDFHHSSWYYWFFFFLYLFVWVIPIFVLFFRSKLTFRNILFLILIETWVIIILFVIGSNIPREIWRKW